MLGGTEDTGGVVGTAGAADSGGALANELVPAATLAIGGTDTGGAVRVGIGGGTLPGEGAG